ncbi:MAG: ATP-binding protein [Pseudomonadota bacterium]
MTDQGTRGLSRWRVLGPFTAAFVVLLGLCIGGYEMLSAVRAFVGGESLWSKARSVAMAQLRLYAGTGAPDAFARFNTALEVPLGDRMAREELDADRPDLALARTGFLRGGNHADDVAGMVRLYRAFSNTALMRDAIDAWKQGDRCIEELVAIGIGLQLSLAQRGPLPSQEREALDTRLDALNTRLIEVEKRFSASLGEASRAAVVLLEIAILGFAAVMGLGVLVYAGRVLRSTEQHRRQLAEANQRWTLATASDGLGLFEWPFHSGSLLLDARAGALFGLQIGPGGRSVGFDELRTVLHPDDVQAVRAGFNRAVSTGTLLKLRARVRQGDGALRHIEATGIVQKAGPPDQARLLGVLRDVSDEVLRVQLSAEKTAAEQVARARMEFLSRLSHELRTPLNAVLGFSQLLLMDRTNPLSPATATQVRHIETAGVHLLRLVEDVLNITRIDAGQLQVEMQPVALQPVVQSALRLVEAQRQALGIVVVDRLPSEALVVRADPQRLQQVFVNLLSNGCKYNRRGGLLTLSHRVEAGQVLLAVGDQGHGLAADEIGQLFQPFHRLSRHSTVDGTGLGLVIARQLLLQMDGEVDVTSVQGQGSTFTVRLALAGGDPTLRPVAGP